MQKKYKNTFYLIFKIVVSVFAFLYIYLKIKNLSFSEFRFPPLSLYSYFMFAVAILLMPVNWFIETIKWRFLILKIEKISLLKAFKAVLSGISFALISPNRIGELAGRVLILEKENRGKAVFITAVGSLSQMLITLIVGIFFGLFVIFFFPEKLQIISSEQLFYLKIVSIASVVFGLLLIFNLRYFTVFLKKTRIKNKFIKYIEILSEYSSYEIIKILVFSLLRYIIFSFQFVLLLYFFDVEISLTEAFTGIALTYLLSSVIPVLSILEIGIRGTAAILFLGMFSENISGILSAVAVLWLINLAVPAITGIFIFYRTKI